MLGPTGKFSNWNLTAVEIMLCVWWMGRLIHCQVVSPYTLLNVGSGAEDCELDDGGSYALVVGPATANKLHNG